MTKQLKFTVGGFFCGYKTVEISIGTKKVSYKILRNGLEEVTKKKSRTVEVSDEWLAEFDALDIFSWEKNYSNAETCDGTQWELTLKHGRKSYRGGGSNAYPENWTRFLDWLDALIPEMHFVYRERLEKVTLNYSREELFETLTLDRRKKSLTLDKNFSHHVYNLDLKEIFDAAQSLFDNAEIQQLEEFATPKIKIELVRHDGSIENFETIYSEACLPGLTEFITKIRGVVNDLTAEIFTPGAGNVINRQGKYIFCKVQFKDSYKSYSYRTEDETLSVGDVVDVPVGKNNDVAQARIVEIGYFDEAEAPFPIDRIKKIIGKHIADDWENY